MRHKKLLLTTIALASLLLLSSTAFAAPNASLLYYETDLGGGLWQYDYTFYNTSDAGEDLYSVYFYFTQDTSFTGTSLPAGWDGIVWDGNTWTTNFADTYSTAPGYDIVAGSYLSGFSFTVDYRAGDVSYDAYFSEDNVVSGTTAIVPEPISSILFLSGGAALGIRQWVKRRRQHT